MATLLYLAIPLFLTTLWLEWVLVRRAQQRRPQEITGHERRDSVASVAMGLGNMAVSALVQGSVLALYFWLYEHRLFEIGQGVGAWIALFFVEDFTYYWWHRASHEVRFLWAALRPGDWSPPYNVAPLRLAPLRFAPASCAPVNRALDNTFARSMWVVSPPM